MNSDRGATDPVGLTWLLTVRWTTLVAGVGAIAAGRSGLQGSVPVGTASILLAISALSNAWLTWRVRLGRTSATTTAAGALMCADVLLLSWLLRGSGGILNPATVFFLVQIVVAALVLGQTWTWIVTALSIGAYATLFLTPPAELGAAQTMHPEIGLHVRGMWIGFACTALIIAILVTRLAAAVERRDRALESLRDRNSRDARFAALTTVMAGAAHELSTPLASVAVAAREMELALERHDTSQLLDDARLIRTQSDRCRQLLDQMAMQIAEPMGQAPRSLDIRDVLGDALNRVDAGDRARVASTIADMSPVMWPPDIVSQAIGSLVRNALQASPADAPVQVDVARRDDGLVAITVIDHGRGMPADELARAGEPFFSTKPPGAGAGLGLFVARSAIKQLGGNLTLSSIPNRGTTATILLPSDVVRSPEGRA